MKRFSTFLFLLLVQLSVQAQDLIWNTYPDGSFNYTYMNIGNRPVNVNVAVSGSTSSLNAREPNGRPTGLRLVADYPTSGNYVAVTITFSQPVNHLSFFLYDIDYLNGDSMYQDLVTVTGNSAGAPVYPTIGSSPANAVTGNRILGLNSDVLLAQNLISFDSPVNSIVILYIAGPAFVEPETQEIYIGNFNWDDAGLPVRLVDFTGQCVENKVVLGWQTSYEDNSDYFAVERSPDAQAYETIGRRGAKGFSQRLQTYGFTDSAPLKGLNYYRLRQVDRDGRFDYSKVVAVAYDAAGFYFQVVVLDRGRLEVTTNAAEPVFSLVDVRGIPSLYRTERVGAGRYILHLMPTGLATAGLQFVRMHTNHSSCTQKVLLN